MFFFAEVTLRSTRDSVVWTSAHCDADAFRVSHIVAEPWFFFACGWSLIVRDVCEDTWFSSGAGSDLSDRFLTMCGAGRQRSGNSPLSSCLKVHAVHEVHAGTCCLSGAWQVLHVEDKKAMFTCDVFSRLFSDAFPWCLALPVPVRATKCLRLKGMRGCACLRSRFSCGHFVVSGAGTLRWLLHSHWRRQMNGGGDRLT